MVTRTSQEPPPEQLDACRRCELWEQATRGVPGEGAPNAKVMLVGEQPGSDEDMVGRPFVGPAGKLLRELLREAGITVAHVFITNAVKHFYHEFRGKRRIHKTPLQRHVAACHVWLEQELASVRPTVIVALGATALAALAGRKLSIAAARQMTLLHPESGIPLVATYHPSAVLRVPDQAARLELRATLLADLRRAGRIARGGDDDAPAAA